LLGLFVGEGGAEWRDAEVAAAGGEGDGDGVHRAFDEHGGGVAAFDVAGGEQLGALVEQGRVGGVEVLRRPGVGVVGVAAADEPEDPAVRVGDGEHDPVAEPVDEASGGGGGGQAGGEEFGVGDPAVVEVLDQGGPAGGGVAGGVVGVAGQVGAEPVAQVAGRPAVGVAAGVEVGGPPVDLQEPVLGDGAVVPDVAPVQLVADLEVGRLREGHGAAEQRLEGQVQVDEGVFLGGRFGGIRGVRGGGWFRGCPAVVEVGGREGVVTGRVCGDVVVGVRVRGGGDGDPPREGLGRVEVPGGVQADVGEQLGELPAALQGVLDGVGERGPERRFLQQAGGVIAEQVGELVGPVVGDPLVGVELPLGGGGEAAGDPPPQGGGGVVVGQRPVGGGLPDQLVGGDAGGGELGEQPGQGGGVGVVVDHRRQRPQQRCPFGEGGVAALGDPLVEGVLPAVFGVAGQPGAGGP